MSGNLPCSESTMDQGEAPRKLPQSIRRRWSYKQAVSKAAEKWHHMDDEALTPPCTKTALPVCPGRKVVQPVRMFLQTVRKKQMLVTLTSASRPSVMKSFMKSNTVHHLDAESPCDGFLKPDSVFPLDGYLDLAGQEDPRGSLPAHWVQGFFPDRWPRGVRGVLVGAALSSSWWAQVSWGPMVSIIWLHLTAFDGCEAQLTVSCT
ncbi:uncharacterized protein [Notamacropus eugenii]|uniref:uncharacterized protein isoform X1 n=1 Tax=Notamacropus eugenii TaxID=9315 RepID=UPI003B67FA04